MFKSVLLLGHFRGIPIQVHVSWLIIFALLMVTMTTGFQQQYEHWPFMTAVTTALLTSLMFFASIVAHELGHSLVAIRRGVPVGSITLFIFGGVAEMTSDSRRAVDEFWIAIAGPLVSVALAVIFSVLSAIAGAWHEPVAVGLGWLAAINFLVALFNMIPGFPLDGGRVFRALVWKVTGDQGKGTRAAVTGGRIVAYGLFAFGLWQILVLGSLLGGFWMILIGWFLLIMAEGHGRNYDLRERLSGVKARDIADRDVPLVRPETRIQDWVNHQVLPHGYRSCMVGDGRRFLGLISLSDARRISDEYWASARVTEVMTPIEYLTTVTMETPAEKVLELMSQHNLNQLPVTEGDRIVAWIDRHKLLRILQLHMEVRH